MNKRDDMVPRAILSFRYYHSSSISFRYLRLLKNNITFSFLFFDEMVPPPFAFFFSFVPGDMTLNVMKLSFMFFFAAIDHRSMDGSTKEMILLCKYDLTLLNLSFRIYLFNE